MRTCLLSLVMFALLVCCGAAAMGATYYVATTGSDSNPGTIAQPWRTLDYAVQTIANGDTIQVRAGTYVGCLIENPGVSGGVKTLMSYPGEAVLVNTPGPRNRHNSIIEVENASLPDGLVKYWTIDGFEIANSPDHYGADLRSTTYCTVRNCYAHNNGLTGIFIAHGYYSTMNNNESAYNGEHGSYYSDDSDYGIEYLNLMHHNDKMGMHHNGGAGYGAGDGLNTAYLCERNIIWENGLGGGAAIDLDGSVNSIVRNNLVYNNHASGIGVYAIGGAAGPTGCKVYNNTVVMASGARNVVYIPKSAKGRPNPSANLLKNNVLYTPDTTKCTVFTFAASVFAAGGSDYNAVVNRFNISGKETQGNIITLAQWQTYGLDTHSFLSTPTALFVDPTNGNYHLKAGSPAANTGTNLSPDVTNDLDGEARPQGSAYDIGCYEDW